MDLKINGVAVTVFPESFTVTPLDLDDAEASVRTADGTLNRDRIAVKRQIEIEWGLLTWSQASSILQAMKDVFFDLYYPDPMDGEYATRTFYVGNRPTPALMEKDGVVYWSGIKATLTER